MRTLHCFVITPSGQNPPMRLVEDDKHGLCVAASSCKGHHAKEFSVNFKDVYQCIILEAIDKVNTAIASKGLNIKCTRGEDLAQSGDIVQQFLKEICRAEITITDVTGLNPNVLLEYGIRLSVKDSLNIVLCHKDSKLPTDIADQRCILYGLDPPEVRRTQDAIVQTILTEPEDLTNLFRLTVELETGRTLERQLAKALEPAPALLVGLVNEVLRLDQERKLRGDGQLRADPKLRDRAWSFLETLAKTLLADPLGRERAIEVYRLLTTLDGFRDKRRDAFTSSTKSATPTPPERRKRRNTLSKRKRSKTDLRL